MMGAVFVVSMLLDTLTDRERLANRIAIHPGARPENEDRRISKSMTRLEHHQRPDQGSISPSG